MSESMYESGKYLASNPDWHAHDAPFKALWIAGLLKRAGLEPGHVVEIGCGSGAILAELLPRFPETRFDGYDISPQAMAIARSKAHDRLAFHHEDYLQAKADRPDLLMAIDVFEHVPDYMGFITAMQPLAEWKIFHIPLDLSVQGLLLGRSLMHARQVVGHLHYFCKDTALATLRDCGYEIADWTYTHGAESLPDKSLRTRLFNIPRRLVRALNADFGVRLMGGASMLVLAR